MPVSYDKLWKMLIDKKMNRTDLKDAAGISFNGDRATRRAAGWRAAFRAPRPGGSAPAA